MSKRRPIRSKRDRSAPRGNTPGVVEIAFWLLLILIAVIAGVQALFNLPLRDAPRMRDGRAGSYRTETEPQKHNAAVRRSRPDAAPRPAYASIVPTQSSAANPAIAIVIDDLGNDVAATRRAIALPKYVTLSFLPYPDATPMLVREAERARHQILVHVPMQPEGSEDAGPKALLTYLTSDEITRRLDWAFSRVPGASGMNNHMGSRFTANRDALVPVMQDVAARHVFVLDSRTTAQTRVIDVAREFGVPSVSRDIFLDDEATSAAVENELHATEVRAREKGIAIAIGHPYPVTLSALEQWAAPMNVRLVSVGEAVALETQRARLRSAVSR